MPVASLAEAIGAADDLHRDTVYSIYGIGLATAFPIRSHLQRGQGPADLIFSFTRTAPHPPNTGSGEYLEVPDTAERKPGWIYLDRLATVDIISYPRIFDFYVWPDRILCHLRDDRYEAKIEIALLGTVLAYWLERSGIPALHASAVEVDGQAVAFLANNQGGKTSLAVAFMQAGHPLITDDILPLERIEGTFFGRTGYPQLRLWPHQAERLLPECDRLEFIHPAIPKYRVPIGDRFGTFSDESKPLRCIYLPERREANAANHRRQSIEITPLPPREGLKALLSKAFAPMLAEATGLRAQRLGFFVSLLQQASIRRLGYPSGVEHLPAVRNAIAKDLSCSATEPV